MARTRGAPSRAAWAKILFGFQDVGGHKDSAFVGDTQVGVVHLGQAQDLGGVDEGEQVVDLESQLVGQLGQVLPFAVGDQDLEQAGHAAHAGLG